MPSSTSEASSCAESRECGEPIVTGLRRAHGSRHLARTTDVIMPDVLRPAATSTIETTGGQPVAFASDSSEAAVFAIALPRRASELDHAEDPVAS
jgi:hypothetical protein